MNSTIKCSISVLTNESDCCKKTYCRLTGMKSVEELSEEDIELVCWRSGVERTNLTHLCFYHEQKFLKKYSKDITNCCNPFDVHDKSKKGIYQTYCMVLS